MITTIDNTQKVFMITGDMNKKVFCNLKDVPNAIRYFDDNTSIEMYMFWNNKRKRVSKRKMNEFFVSNQITERIN